MFGNYLKVAAKVLLRRKFFTFISLFGVSVTLLVTLVATALLDQVFAPIAPETRGDRTLGVYAIAWKGPSRTRTGFPGYAFLDRYVRPMAALPGVERVSVVSLPHTATSYQGGRRIESWVKRTDGEFWRILDFHFLEGGPLTAADEAAGRPVAVINETTRRRFFAGRSALGRQLELDGQSFRVVGVVPDVPILRLVPYADVWVPLSTAPSSTYRHEMIGGYMGVVLARSRADFAAIQGDYAARLKQVQPPDPHSYQSVAGGIETFFDAVSRALFSQRLDASHPGLLRAVLFAVLLLFLLMPTINLINLNLSRILERASEIGVRRSFGASSWTLVGQFLVENLVLTLVGAGLGLALAALVLAAINASGLLPYARLGINPRVFLEGLSIALFFGVLSGVYPAFRMSRLHPVQALSGRTA
jgi:putative ABC transport system permease protein